MYNKTLVSISARKGSPASEIENGENNIMMYLDEYDCEICVGEFLIDGVSKNVVFIKGHVNLGNELLEKEVLNRIYDKEYS